MLPSVQSQPNEPNECGTDAAVLATPATRTAAICALAGCAVPMQPLPQPQQPLFCFGGGAVPYPRRIPAVLSVEEVTLLLRAATAPKYKAAFATAYGAGLRVSEVVALKVGDIDSARMLLRVERGKGRKDRHAMLSPQLLECCAPGGGRGGGGACCCREVGCSPAATRSNRCRPASSAAPSVLAPKPRGSGSACRHTRCGTVSPRNLLEQDVDIRVIQTLLGHAKLDTTALYTRVANTTIRAVTSPLDRLAPLIDGRPRPEA